MEALGQNYLRSLDTLSREQRARYAMLCSAAHAPATWRVMLAFVPHLSALDVAAAHLASCCSSGWPHASARPAAGWRAGCWTSCP